MNEQPAAPLQPPVPRARRLPFIIFLAGCFLAPLAAHLGPVIYLFLGLPFIYMWMVHEATRARHKADTAGLAFLAGLLCFGLGMGCVGLLRWLFRA